MNIIRLEQTNSTNSVLAGMAATAPHATVVSTRCQTAGRGQRGNSWESEPGMNVTLSILIKPTQPLSLSLFFQLSEAAALGAADFLDTLICGVEVKWPNDIYVNNRKIAGILIENSLNSAGIERSIIGIGLNVNQLHFLSDAPNPVSLLQITDLEYPLEEIEVALAQAIISRIDSLISNPDSAPALHAEYLSRLWRRDGYHKWQTPDGQQFEASISTINPSGHISLLLADNSLRTFAFKEVAAIL